MGRVVGAIFAIGWVVIGGPGSDIGGKLGPESDKMVTKRARWSQHSQLGVPDGRVDLGWRVNERVWGPTNY